MIQQQASFKKVRIGILGAANIAKKNIRAIALSKDCLAAGIASRSIVKAEQFLQEVGQAGKVPVFPSYEALINSEEIDALYVPLPTAVHLEWVQKAALAGKHILLEKPTAIDLKTLQQMMTICKENNVFLMDGVMFMHHSRTRCLSDFLQDPLTSPAQKVISSFSFHGDQAFLENNIRASASGDPLGALGDLGWYCIRLGLLAFNKGNDMTAVNLIVVPCRCKATCLLWSDDGVPLSCFAQVSFSNDHSRELIFDCSFNTAFRQRYEIVCTTDNSNTGGPQPCDKVVTCDDFVIPRNPYNASFTVETIAPGLPLVDSATRVMSQKVEISCPTERPHTQQEVAMFDEFARVINDSGAGKPHWQHWSLLTQAVVDACMKSMKDNGSEVAMPGAAEIFQF